MLLVILEAKGNWQNVQSINQESIWELFFRVFPQLFSRRVDVLFSTKPVNTTMALIHAPLKKVLCLNILSTLVDVFRGNLNVNF